MNVRIPLKVKFFAALRLRPAIGTLLNTGILFAGNSCHSKY